MTTEAREQLLKGIATFDAPGPVATDITPRDWYINRRTGWPWPGLIARSGDGEELAEARRRAASRIRVLRLFMADDRLVIHPLYSLLPRERVSAARAEIRSLREIFARPAPRPGRPDLAGVWDGAASRDGAALPEAPDCAPGASPGPAASFPRRGGRDLSP
jgi:hypothetical protein